MYNIFGPGSDQAQGLVMKSRLQSYQDSTPDVGEGVWIAPGAQVIGQVTLGDDVSIWPGSIVRGDVNGIRIGARTNIQDQSVLHVTHDGPFTPGGRALEIGADVTVGHRVILHACTVGDGCLIGMGAILMDDVVVGEQSLIAAGSLIPPGKRIGPRELWRGSPARKVRTLNDEELEQLSYSAGHYVRLKNRYLNQVDTG